MDDFKKLEAELKKKVEGKPGFALVGCAACGKNHIVQPLMLDGNTEINDRICTHYMVHHKFDIKYPRDW